MAKVFILLLGLAVCAGMGLFTALFAVMGLSMCVQGLADGSMDTASALGTAVVVALSAIIAGLSFLGARACRRRFEKVRPPAVHPEGLRLATPNRRMWALGADSLLLIPAVIASYFLPWSAAHLFMANNLYYLLFQGYCIAMLAWRGQTLGKMALGVKVVRLDGSPAGLARILARSSVDVLAALSLFALDLFAAGRLDRAAWSLSYAEFEDVLLQASPGQSWGLAVLCLWYLADYLTMLLSPGRRSLHDRLGGTMALSIRAETTRAEKSP